MDILSDSKIDFMKYRKVWVALSLLTIVAGLVGIFFLGRLNFGVDFAGGTQLTVKFKEGVDVEGLRALVSGAGIKDPVIQRFGEVGANEVIIRTPIMGGSEEGSAQLVIGALNGKYNPGVAGEDLNLVGSLTISELLSASDPDGVGPGAAASHYSGVAESLRTKRKTLGIFTSWDQVASADGVSPAAAQVLKSRTALGSFAVLGTENVGPVVGAELRRQGFLAVVGALIGMLLYVWVRFELRFGIGATMATLHDVLVTLGIFAWFGYEFNLTSIAAFLTLIGYSMNDTVVTFDRVRENLRKNRTLALENVLNTSLNQMLSRTLLTGGMVIGSSLCLLIWGGDTIRGFAFIMFVGVIVGTYSSIYIASPFALFWESWFGPGGRFRRGAKAPDAKPAAAKR